MRRVFIAALTAIIAVSCAGSSELQRNNWNSGVYDALNSMIRECADGQRSAYAVFDFDNTTIMNDISMTLMIYQAENMRYAFAPDEAFGCFTAWLPDLDKVLDGPGMSAGELGGRLARDYGALTGMLAGGMSLEQIHSTEEFLDFRATLLSLNEGVENSFDYATWCLWQPSLFTGMTYAELEALTRESADYWLSQGRIWTECWESPDGRLSVGVLKGLALPEESINLYKTLQDNGIDVYICSASLEVVVEAMACDPVYGLGLPAERVFGIRTADKDRVGGGFEQGYDQTFLEGKTACIRRFMAPSHGGADPVLVAGDSNGDYDMLTAFDSLKVGLIIDCGRSGPIASLADSARRGGNCSGPIYVVQSRDLSIPGYVR